MQTLRRRLASCALALILVQTALAFAAPLSACCTTKPTAAADADECCPAGSHPPGQCPRHARSNGAPRVSCRLQCDAPHGLQFVAGVTGVLPVPLAVTVPSADAGAIAFVPAVERLRSSDPTSPPPRVR